MNILVIAPHPDDEVLGVGGTIKNYSNLNFNVYICVVTSVIDNDQLLSKIREESRESHKILGATETIFLDFPVLKLKEIDTKLLNSRIKNVIQRTKPDIVFLPHKGDMHIDHYYVFNSAMVALRPHESPFVSEIYTYETLSETEWNDLSPDNLFVGNVWFDISDTIEDKLLAMKKYNSQLMNYPHPRSLRAIRALSEYRGSNMNLNNAECFHLVRFKK